MTELSLAHAVLDRFAFGIIAADRAARPVLQNRAAGLLLQPGRSPITLDRSRLSASSETETALLRDAIARAARYGGTPRVLGLGAGDDPLACLVVVGPLVDAGGLAVLAVCRKEHGTPRELWRLSALWSLTATEAAVAAHIGSGRSLTQAASRLNVAHSTARTHLDHVFAKAGVRSQAELTRAVTLAAMIR